VYLNEGTGPFDPAHPTYAGSWGSEIPSCIDLLSIDDYCLRGAYGSWPTCSAGQPADEVARVRGFLAQHVVPRLASPRQQRLLVVPGLFMDSNLSRSGTLAQQEQLMIGKLNAYEPPLAETLHSPALYSCPSIH
jgi:hypothetical protein